MKLGKKKKNQNKDDFLAEEAKQEAQTAPEYTLDIPEDEIWTYQIEGLQQPKVGIAPENAKIKKIIVIIVLLIAISASIFLSIKALYNEEYDAEQLDNGTYELIAYSNPGTVTDITVDYVDGDKSKPITVIHEYAFNCDEQIREVYISKDVEKIDSKSFYSCWSLQAIYVDDDNPYYCDLNGVLYNKDMTELICYPICYDKHLCFENEYTYTDENGVEKTEPYAYIDENGEQHFNLVDDSGNEMDRLWGTTEKYDQAFVDEYNLKCRTYVVPNTVETIGELSMAYSDITDLYLPEGLKNINSMALFKNTVLLNIYSYTKDSTVTSPYYTTLSTLEIYNSLPDGLEYIGSDCFTNDRGLSYMYIPASVKEIGHHAFWDGVYKEDGELKGITAMNVAADEETFNNSVTLGNQWLAKYDKGLFKKNIDVNYSAKRQ